WVPEYESFPVTLSPDTDPANPLFFDLLPVFCRHAGISVNRASGGSRNPFWRTLLPLKYVMGEWFARLRERNANPSEVTERRPVIVGNLDNDFHRQFDLGRLGPAALKMFAWIRGPDAMVPVERLL